MAMATPEAARRVDIGGHVISQAVPKPPQWWQSPWSRHSLVPPCKCRIRMSDVLALPTPFDQHNPHPHLRRALLVFDKVELELITSI